MQAEIRICMISRLAATRSDARIARLSEPTHGFSVGIPTLSNGGLAPRLIMTVNSHIVLPRICMKYQNIFCRLRIRNNPRNPRSEQGGGDKSLASYMYMCGAPVWSRSSLVPNAKSTTKI